MIGAPLPPSHAIRPRDLHREVALGGHTFASILAAPAEGANRLDAADARTGAIDARQAVRAGERAWDRTNVRFDELHLLRSVDHQSDTGARELDAAPSPRTIAPPADPPVQYVVASCSAGAYIARAVEHLGSPATPEHDAQAPRALSSAGSTGSRSMHETAPPIHSFSTAEHPPSMASRETKHLHSTQRRPHDGGGVSFVFVAFNASDGGARVVARIGRMPPTERQRLRQGIDALLAEYGIHHASISVNGEGDVTWPKSPQ